MMPFLSFEILTTVTGGRWILLPAVEKTGIRGIWDDSRRIGDGALFVAIAGEITDGHRFLKQAAIQGAAAVVVQRELSPEEAREMKARGCGCILVPDTLRAYQQLARWHRLQFPKVKIVAVTGSCGKTSTKEFCAAMLEEHFPGGVIKTIGSTNNHFGVPRNLLRIDEATRAAVIELGSNHPGEIANLVSMVQPDVSLICSIGHAHLEFFHDLEGVACEKGDIYCGTPPEGTAVVPMQAPHAELLLRKAGLHPVTTFAVDDETADVSATYRGFSDGAFRVRLHWRKTNSAIDGVIAVGGRHAASNAACAAAATTAMGCTPAECMAGLAACVLPGERQKIIERGGITYINDAFNSNPDSARAAVDFFKESLPEDAHAVLLLGDMLELGGGSQKLHEELLSYAKKVLPAAQMAVVGPLMTAAVSRLNLADVRCFPDAECARRDFLPSLQAGSWVLLKSSHGIGLAQLTNGV